MDINLYEWLIEPFAEFDFMRYALASVVFLALSAAPVGVFLVMRRMSLVGDALGHAVLPGAAVGYMIGGLSLPAMSAGGFVAGMVMALLAGLVSRFTDLKEDANFAAFYLTSLAIGVLLVSMGGSNIDLLHLLFGSILAVDLPALTLVASVASTTIITLAVIYRPLLLERRTVAPDFPRLGRHEPGGRISGFGYADGSRPDDDSGDHRPPVGAQHGYTDAAFRHFRAAVRAGGAAVFLPRRNPVRPGHHPVLRRLVHTVGHLRLGGRPPDQMAAPQPPPAILKTV